MRVLHVVAETPLSFLQHLKDITYIERRPLRYAHAFSSCFDFLANVLIGSALNVYNL
jgi:hypothetical protein